MIPTGARYKLPRHLSYPVGAKSIRDALAGAPHFEALSVGFYDTCVYPGSKFRRLLLERQPYKVMEARYQPARKPGISAMNKMVEWGRYDEDWRLSVYPVLVEYRHLVNRLLVDQGLPAIVRWLKNVGQGWLDKHMATTRITVQPGRGSPHIP